MYFFHQFQRLAVLRIGCELSPGGKEKKQGASEQILVTTKLLELKISFCCVFGDLVNEKGLDDDGTSNIPIAVRGGC